MQLDSLEGLSVKRNKLVGSLPSTLGSMTALEALYVSGNSLNGTFPWQSFAQNGDCSLRKLDISHNSFSGSIPWEAFLTKFTCLEGLSLGNSGVTGGSLPSTGFQNLTSLELFDLEKIKLTGTIPESIGDMTRLTRLAMDDNSLEGTIPSSLGRLQKLRTLRLQRNSLTGTVPTELGNILALGKFWPSHGFGFLKWYPC
jgi:Leucine-rich repeat (LRR) protein